MPGLGEQQTIGLCRAFLTHLSASEALLLNKAPHKCQLVALALCFLFVFALTI